MPVAVQQVPDGLGHQQAQPHHPATPGCRHLSALCGGPLGPGPGSLGHLLHPLVLQAQVGLKLKQVEPTLPSYVIQFTMHSICLAALTLAWAWRSGTPLAPSGASGPKEPEVCPWLGCSDQVHSSCRASAEPARHGGSLHGCMAGSNGPGRPDLAVLSLCPECQMCHCRLADLFVKLFHASCKVRCQN